MKGDCNICVNGKLPSYSATCVECGLSRKNYKPITNDDRIRAKSIKELAELLSVGCPYRECGKSLEELDSATCCMDCWLDWLKQEATND